LSGSNSEETILTSSVVRYRKSTGDARVISMADALSVPDGGFSVDPRTGATVRGGYAVAVFPERERQFAGPVSADEVSAYVFANADVLTKGGVVVGGWRNPDDGVAYLDVSRVVPTRAEAATLAREHNQVAYFDFASGVSVPI
jgi:hypothetical protein